MRIEEEVDSKRNSIVRTLWAKRCCCRFRLVADAGRSLDSPAEDTDEEERTEARVLEVIALCIMFNED